MSSMFRLAALALIFGCTHPTGSTTTRTDTVKPPEHAPRLVVLLVIDQFPEWAFEQKRPALTAGFARLLREGAWHVGQHPSAATLTAPGHALLGTGQPPAYSGILANKWWRRDLDKELDATKDEAGNDTAAWLKVPGIADSVATRPGAKAIAVSLKSRAAILALGHAGTPIWYDARQAGFRSFAPVAWLDAYNHANPIQPHLVPWVADPRDAELSGTVDDQPGEAGEKGFGPTFPHDPLKTKDPADAIYAMPYGNDAVLDLATAAITAEQLGADKTPDLLVISLSANDYIAHGWGQESWEAWDAVVKLDVRLGTFLADLDRLVPGGWSLIATSDHGSSPLPERIHGGRLTHEGVGRAANNAAAAVLGQGNWIANAHYPNIFFTKAMLAQPKGELASAVKHILYALKAIPGIAQSGKVSDVAGDCDKRTGDARALCLAFDPERSGDLFYLPAPGWIVMDEDEATATAHGSLNAYDRLVPVIELSPDRKPHAVLTAPDEQVVEMTQIAPTLAAWLGVPAPAKMPSRR